MRPSSPGGGGGAACSVPGTRMISGEAARAGLAMAGVVGATTGAEASRTGIRMVWVEGAVIGVAPGAAVGDAGCCAVSRLAVSRQSEYDIVSSLSEGRRADAAPSLFGWPTADAGRPGRAAPLPAFAELPWLLLIVGLPQGGRLALLTGARKGQKMPRI